MKYDFIIIGAGVAGLTAAAELHRRAPESSIFLADKESRLPYKRTKLSKELARGFSQDQFALYPTQWYSENRIDLGLGLGAERIDTAQRRIFFEGGKELEYGKLLLCLGARPVIPKGFSEIKEWLVLRNIGETEAIRERISDEEKVCVMGNGVLGVEIAEQLILSGKEAFLLSRHPLPLHRDLTEEASLILKSVLEDRGVRLVKSCPKHLHTALAAVGTAPAPQLAQKAGLKVNHGLLVDDFLQTSVPGIWAAGDCTENKDGRICHLWHEAENMALAAAQFMTGRTESFEWKPFRLKMEVFGEYFFSMGKPDTPWEDRVERRVERQYQCFFFSYDKLQGVVMTNDKERNKTYEQAVWEHWDRERVLSAFAL